MGRGRGRGQKRRTMSRDFGRKGGREDAWDPSKRQKTHWEGGAAESPAFEEYYRAQNILPDDEWDTFLATLRTQLPLTFRINGRGRFAEALLSKLRSNFFSDFASGPLIIDGEVVNPPTCLAWYPDHLAWQLEFSRTQLRKVPKLSALHEFMKRETDIGAITRQEAVSMVPPLFMDVQPHHRVLDMCAAPGSKTAQLLEALHAGAGEPTGVVVANDADVQRCNMLTHQTQRIRSPSFFVTNHEAQAFPLLWDLDPASTDVKVAYDRILADVPCSGDGTLRKQPDIWRRWGPASGNGLHLLQIKITLRGCELLRVGGRMVYSTCTFNPIEDEAVVAEVIRRCGGSMRLVDVSSELPALKRRPGLTTWRVRDKERWYDTPEEGQSGWKLDPSMWPPATQEEAEALGLPLCMRFFPHDQDTGGFFVCVLEKTAPIEGLVYPTAEGRAAKSKWSGDKVEGEKTEGEEEKKEEGEGEGEGEVKKEEATAAAEEGEEEKKELSRAEQAKAEGARAAARMAEIRAARNAPPPKELPEWGVRGGGARSRAEETAAAAAAAAAAAEAAAAAADTLPDAPAEEAIATDEPHAPLPDAAAPDAEAAQPARPGGRWRGIDPFVPFTDTEELAAMRAAYGLPPECHIPDSLIARSHEPRPKKLAYLSPGCKLLLRMDAREQLKVTAGGVKMFERQENRDNLLSTCYRVSQEGLPLVLPWMTRQLFQPTAEEVLRVLRDRVIGLPAECKVHITKGAAAEGEAVEGAEKMGEAVEGAEKAGETAEGAEGAEKAEGDAAGGEGEPKKGAGRQLFHFSDPATLEQLGAVDYGCCVATLRTEDAAALGLAGAEAGGAEGGLAANAPIAITCWRGRGTLNVLVSKQECAQMADRLEDAMKERAAREGTAA